MVARRYFCVRDNDRRRIRFQIDRGNKWTSPAHACCASGKQLRHRKLLGPAELDAVANQHSQQREQYFHRCSIAQLSHPLLSFKTVRALKFRNSSAPPKTSTSHFVGIFYLPRLLAPACLCARINFYDQCPNPSVVSRFLQIKRSHYRAFLESHARFSGIAFHKCGDEPVRSYLSE